MAKRWVRAMGLLWGMSMLLHGQTYVEHLSRAVVEGDLAEVKAHVESWKEDLNKYDRSGWTAIHWAIYHDQGAVFEYLLSQGADPKLTTLKGFGSMPKGSTTVYMAAYYGHDAMLAALLKAGVDPDVALTPCHITALDWAKKFRFTSTVELLKRWKVEHPK